MLWESVCTTCTRQLKIHLRSLAKGFAQFVSFLPRESRPRTKQCPNMASLRFLSRHLVHGWVASTQCRNLCQLWILDSCARARGGSKFSITVTLVVCPGMDDCRGSAGRARAFGMVGVASPGLVRL